MCILSGKAVAEMTYRAYCLGWDVEPYTLTHTSLVRPLVLNLASCVMEML